MFLYMLQPMKEFIFYLNFFTNIIIMLCLMTYSNNDLFTFLNMTKH